MRETNNIRQLVALKPDFIGFILYPGSKRYVGNEFALEFDIPDKIIRVGVFVNALMDEVIHWVNQLGLQYVQLHGTEPVEYCRELAEMKIRIIKAFGMDELFDFTILNTYNNYCDYFLFDTKSSMHGGSGQKFDWNFITRYNANRPIFLSGGIGPDDVESILMLNKKISLFGVDINSRFEIVPGLKDIKLLRQFIKSIRKNDSQSK